MTRSMRFALATVLLAAFVGCQLARPEVKTATNSDLRQENAQLARAKSPPSQQVQVQSVAQSRPSLETVALFRGPIVTGVAVSRTGRIFVNFPHWGAPVEC